MNRPQVDYVSAGYMIAPHRIHGAVQLELAAYLGEIGQGPCPAGCALVVFSLESSLDYAARYDEADWIGIINV